MTNPTERTPELFESHTSGSNKLWQYVRSMPPETVAQLSKPDPEVAQLMEHNLLQMLGGLPSEHFDVTITTDRENLSRLLASAMMNGYFLYKAKQRMEFEKSVANL
ncbi:MAG: DUF760 domain-containing protein [Limnospira sp.]